MLSKEHFHFKKALDIITEVNKPKWVKLHKTRSVIDGSKAYMKVEDNQYVLSFVNHARSKQLELGRDIKRIAVISKKFQYACQDFYIRNYAPPKFGAVLSFFYSKGFAKKNHYYFKLLIPLSTKYNFHYELQRIHPKGGEGYLKSSTCATVNHDTIYINVIRDDKLGYFLSFESQKKQSLDVFSDKVHAVKNALGYLTGHLAGNKGYYFAYGNKKMDAPKHFYICGIRDEIKSQYTPIHSNSYGWIRSKKAEKYRKDPSLREVSLAEFSELCQRLHDSSELTVVIIVILESLAASLLIMPGGMSIALETLADVIGKNKGKLSPIKDGKVSSAVRKECEAIVKKHCSTLDPDDLTTLLKRIEQLNQMTNKARLKAPFEKLGIKLLPKDLEILETRNDFLHGRTPDISKDGEPKSSSKVNRELYYASMRFYTLLNILILKSIGFDGRVVNYPKVYQPFTKIRLSEEPFRLIEST